jgi:hypothetical protein
MNHLTEIFGEPISVYTTKQAIDDGLLVKTGYLQPNNIPVLFTSNLFTDVKDHYQKIIEQGLALLKQPDKQDSSYMKLRVIEKNKIWVIANTEGVTFMKPEDY